MTSSWQSRSCALAGSVLAAQTPAGDGSQKLPFVYTKWKHFTVADGLPNDHIFAVKADGPRVWIGTEDGLACSTSAPARSRAGRRRTACRGAP